MHQYLRFVMSSRARNITEYTPYQALLDLLGLAEPVPPSLLFVHLSLVFIACLLGVVTSAAGFHAVQAGGCGVGRREGRALRRQNNFLTVERNLSHPAQLAVDGDMGWRAPLM